MALAIGYNVKQTNELMASMAQAYNDLGTYISEQWETVRTTMMSNWVGEDELDYEKRFVERLCQLYTDSYNLISNSVDVIGNLAQAWWDFQKNNSITGEAIATSSTINIEKPTITPAEQIVTFVSRTLADSDDRGLADVGSAATIKGAVDTFVSNLNTKTNTLFNIEVSSAFFGDQSSTIKTYVEKVGTAIAAVNVAVKDMYDALDILASSQYTTAVTDASTAVSTETTNVETAVSEISTRWQ